MRKTRPFLAILIVVLLFSSCSSEPVWFDSAVSRIVTELSEIVMQLASQPEDKTAVETVYSIFNSAEDAKALADYGFSESAVSGYGEDYFAEYDLVVLVFRAYSGEEFRIEDITLSEGRITLSITRRYTKPRDETEIFMAMIINAKKGELTGGETVWVYSESVILN